ncbi:Lipid A export ATP-binding/permease protein MsbA [Thermoflexales bacterium]|nr:Lipid A export ATP-binding/permease protein MsbA [Thermoflexales bacterium]
MATEALSRTQSLKQAAANIPAAFRLVWEAHRGATLLMALLTLSGALIPAAQAWVGKLIIDSVVASLTTQVAAQAGLTVVLPYLLIEFALILAQSGITQARSLAEHILHARLNYTLNARLIRKALSLDLTHFENAEFYDKLQNARREADWRALRIMNNGFYIVQNIITLLSFGAILLTFNFWLTLILFGATLPAFLAQSKYAQLHFRLLSWRAPEARQLNYLEYLLTVDTSVKEVKLFGLGEPLLGRYAELFWKFLREDQALAQKRSLASFGWGLLATVSYYFAYAWIVLRTVGGEITLGAMTMYLSIFRNSQNVFETLFFGLSELYENALFMSNLFAFLELKPQMPVAVHPIALPAKLACGIEFRHVSFKYPDREEYALRDVSVIIKPGEKIALVGANGAGKTTFVKLLTRLYDPSEGQVLIDGIDLREVDPKDLQKRIGVIFQDFVKYHLPARENVGFGQIDQLDNEPRIIDAATRSGADSTIRALPQGYNTMLGKWFERGNDLSGGEWQKVALARAFMRDAEVLVLDEPTASLDALNEYAIFQRFRELTDNKIALLISHRFSTVRMADRIVVLDEGQVIEAGTHAELLALGGEYAKLFTIQAEGYR